MESWGFVATVAGLVAGVVGVAIAIAQGRRSGRLAHVTQQGLMEAISQLSPLLMSADDTRTIATFNGVLVAEPFGALERQRHGLDDLYRRLVNQYLTGESEFTSDRLTTATVDGVIPTSEALDVWKQAISQREENRIIDINRRSKRRAWRGSSKLPDARGGK